MAYGSDNAIKAMEKIINDKQGWQIAGNVKHKINGMNAQDYYKQDAQKYYNELIANGYKTAANNLKNSNLEQAQKYVNNYYTKTGRSQFRPYMYEKGKQFGLTNQDIDNLTSFDSETGEVIFAGKNIGRPAGIVNGVSYFDADNLDTIWNNYVNESGITPGKSNMADQLSYKAMNYIDKLTDQQSGNRDYIMNTGNEQRQRKDDFIDSQQNANIFKTDAAKTIMDKFNYMGGVAGGDAIASGASSNNGNIDSFSAANRARQQLAYTSAGADAVIAEYQNRMNNVMETLKSIDSQNLNEYGALTTNYANGLDTAQMYTDNAAQLYDAINAEKQIDQAIENDKKNNWREDTLVKGYFTDYSDNPYLNEDGSLKNPSLNYKAIYDEAVAKGDEQTAKWVSEAGYTKIMSDWDKYGKWYDANIYKPRENNRNKASNIVLQEMANKSAKELAEIAAAAEKYGIDAEIALARAENGGTSGITSVPSHSYKGVSSTGSSGSTSNGGLYAHGESKGTSSTSEKKESNSTSETTSNTTSTRTPSSSTASSDQSNAELSNKEVANIVSDLNKNGALLVPTGNGQYKVQLGTESKVVENIMNSNYTDAQKSYFLERVAGISQKDINKAMKGTTGTSTAPVSNKDVTNIVSNVSKNGVSLMPTGSGEYKLFGSKEKLIDNVINTNYSDEQKLYFLERVVGISQQDINKALNK